MIRLASSTLLLFFMTLMIAGTTLPVRAFDLAWNAGTGNFTGTQTWSYNNDGTLATTSNPFTLVGTSGGIGGENVGFIGNNGNVTLSTTTNVSGDSNLLYGLRVGSNGNAANLSSLPGGSDLRGDGTLTVTGSTPLYLFDENSNAASGNLFVGTEGATGVMNWNSTSTLNVQSQLRIGQGGTGTLNQNSGTVIAGTSAGVPKFMTVGNLGGNGTYNLNNGNLELGLALDLVTGVELPRVLRVGFDPGSTGVFNVGDGVGAAGSARFDTWDEVYIGNSGVGTSGKLNIRSDGFVRLNHASLSGQTSPLVVGLQSGTTGTIHQQGGTLQTDGLLRIGDLGTARYELVGSTGAVTTRALTVGALGTLDFTFDAAGTTPITLEGDLNTAGDVVKGINLVGGASLAINALSNYNSNAAAVLVNSLDPTAGLTGQFGNFTQGALVGTNALGTQFFLNYFGGTDNNDIVLQSTQPGSLTNGLVWNAATANFDAGWARSNGSFGVGAFPVNPFGAGGAEDLYLGKNGTVVLDNTTNTTGGMAVNSLRIGTNQAQARIAGTNGNGTLTANGTASLTIGNGQQPAAGSVTGDLYLGTGGFTGTVNWNSSGTLEVGGKLRIGMGGTGVVNQTAGVITGGTVAGSGQYLSIGEGAGGVGTYNLKSGALRPGGGIPVPAATRLLRVGTIGGTGTLVVGDGVGTADARIESQDDLTIGEKGGTGHLTINSDAYIELDGNSAIYYVGWDNGNGTVVQNGGSVAVDGFIAIGTENGAVGHYTMTGGTLTGAADGGPDEFRIGGNTGTGTFRLGGSGEVTHLGGDLFIAHIGNTNATGRLELVGSDASFTAGRLMNAPGNNHETIRYEADASGVTPLAITGTTTVAGANNFVRLQHPDEVAANTGINGNGDLMGNGINLELDLSAITSSTMLTLLDNQTAEPVLGFFENPLSTMDLYEEGESIFGTGFNGTVSISYLGGTGNDVVLNLVAGAGLAGDFNDDGRVDGNDFLIWQRGGSPNPLSPGDLADWKGNFGAPLQITAAVPEPSVVALTLIAGLAVMGLRRGRIV